MTQSLVAKLILKSLAECGFVKMCVGKQTNSNAYAAKGKPDTLPPCHFAPYTLNC